MKKGVLFALLTVLILLFAAQPAYAAVSGAIFTTTADGSRVNANIYQAKEDVYLDGGPGPNAPSKAAGLPEGWYYFQVTDPSGKVLLSTDPVKCRRFYVNRHGVIERVWICDCTGPGDVSPAGKGKGRAAPSTRVASHTHLTGIDRDHSGLGAITVQLMPYDDTPNRGGVYKVWATPVDKFVGDPSLMDNPDHFHGFVPRWSKTDNFKVRGRTIPPKITVRKFRDTNANGVRDDGEPELFDWTASVEDPLGAEWRGGPQTMPFTVDNALPTGDWKICEELKDGWRQTALIIDGVPQAVSQCAIVAVAGTSGETHEVWFGNIELGCVSARKFHDANVNGEWDDGEVPKSGVTFTLTGVNIRGETVNESKESDTNGWARFCNLLPGDYKVTETVPDGWFPTTDTEWAVSLAEGGSPRRSFGNARYACIKGRKFYDRNTNREWDDGEQPIEGFRFILIGTTYRGDSVGPITGHTDSSGWVKFQGLLPGDYELREVLPTSGGWFATTAMSAVIKLPEGGCETRIFGNACESTCDFDTKGYWHNKNGLSELTQADRDFANSLSPYSSASSYCDSGDEPFDGLFADGTPVAAANGAWAEGIAPAGSWKAEVSHFLVDRNAGGDPREQLAQQLLAFVFNVRHRLGSCDVSVQMPDGRRIAASAVISMAVACWESGSAAQQGDMAAMLDWFNNNDGVRTVCPEPCPVVYE